MRLIDADELLVGTLDHDQISTHLIYNAPTIESCEDAISREAVRLIESDADAYVGDWNDDYEDGFLDAINKVLALPSVAPSRPQDLGELVKGLAESVTLDDAVLTDVEAKAYAKGFKDGIESRPSGEWIPCEERLPDEDVDSSYLIAWTPADEEVKCGLPHYYQVADWEDGDWANIDYCGHDCIVILAWMPLPEPYKENE